MGATDHTSRKHALLSASGASRWLNCTPSARLEEKFDESAPSVYAAEGTLAHEFGDINLRFHNGEINKRTLNKELKRLRKDKLYTDEMEEQVAKYVIIAIESLNMAKQVDPGAIMLIEERFDFSHLIEMGFGTSDTTIIGGNTLLIIDLKYGKGIRVEAEDNPQLKLYASGALQALGLSYDIHTVKMAIVQPRLDHISTAEMSADDLIEWGETIVKPKALIAYKGEGEQKPGDWCKWCKVKAVCVALADKNMELAKHEFRDPQILTDEALLEVYKAQPMLIDWAKAVAEHLLTEALNGKKWDGYKVVEGRSNRKWLDEKEVYIKLSREGFKHGDCVTEKVKGIGKIEKLVGKKEFFPLLGDQVIKPPGAPTLVLESDKRAAMGNDQAKEDFAECDSAIKGHSEYKNFKKLFPKS